MIVQQFSGLLARNGQEIYEGDIVNLYEFGYVGGGHAEVPHLCLVDILRGISNGFHFRKLPLDENCGRCIPKYQADFEVLGNIFETPELLA